MAEPVLLTNYEIAVLLKAVCNSNCKETIWLLSKPKKE